MRYLSLIVLVVFLVGILMIPSAFAQNVPEWVKNTAGWWADDKISEEEEEGANLKCLNHPICLDR